MPWCSERAEVSIDDGKILSDISKTDVCKTAQRTTFIQVSSSSQMFLISEGSCDTEDWS